MTGPSQELTIATLTKAQRQKLQNISSKYEIWYTLGVLNVMVTTIIAVRFPSYYWLFYSIKTMYYLPYRFYRFQKRGWELYLLDWCYLVNFLIDVCVLLAFARVTFGVTTPLSRYNSDLIRAGFAMASGPLATSVFIFCNSIVFYDVDHNTSVFIHLSPFVFLWCLKWGAGYGPGYIWEDFPDMFMVCENQDDYAAADACLQTWQGWLWCDACGAPWTAFAVIPALLYMGVWSVPYFMVVFVWWRDWIQDTGRETLYKHLITTHPELLPWLQKTFHLFGDQYAGPVGYMALHFCWSIGTAGFSYFLWHSFLLHNLVLILIVMSAIHNGSTYMFRVFAYRYAPQQLKKHASALE